jgi:hypothetical protein
MGAVTAINRNYACFSASDHVNRVVDGLCEQPGAAINLFII